MKKKLIILLLLIPLIFTGCKKIDRTISEEIKTNDKYSKNIEVKSTKLDDTIILFLTNKNNITIDTDITINFYDKKKKLIANSEDTYSAITPKKEIVISFEVFKDYDYYEITLSSQKTKYTNYENDISIAENDNKKEKEITFEINNNSKNTIEYIEIAILFYKNKQLVAHDSKYIFKLKKDKKATIEFIYPYTDEFKELEFDSYKVYTNEACSYNKETKDEG